MTVAHSLPPSLGECISPPTCPSASADARLVGNQSRLLAINVAAEIAESRSDVKGPNTFRAALIDSVYNLTPQDIKDRARVRQL